jgi:hypothetical protein
MAAGHGFDDPLKLGDPLVAKGRFDWPACCMIAVYVMQSLPDHDNDPPVEPRKQYDPPPRDLRVVSAVGTPDLKARTSGDPYGPTDEQFWTMELKPPAGGRPLEAGRALATAVALVQKETDGPFELERWCQAIDLED